VLVRDRNGRPRSMGFLLSEVVAFEQRFRVPTSDLDFGADQQEHDDLEPDLLPKVQRAFPPPRRTCLSGRSPNAGQGIDRHDATRAATRGPGREALCPTPPSLISG